MSKIPTDAQWADLASKINGKMNAIDYSTSEQSTGIKWIDGSIIYQKTINLGSLPNSTTKNVAHGISNLDSIVRIEAIITNGTVFAALPFVNTSSAAANIAVNANATNVSVTTGTNRTGYSGYATLYYTKGA